MPKPKDDDFKSISEFNSEWADRIAYLILVGLLVDIGAVFVSNASWRHALTIIADTLIIAGVWGELRFSKRARTADDNRVAAAEKALSAAMDRVADAESAVGEANISAAKAHERAASLEKEAAILQYQITLEQQRHAPRILSDDQKSTLTEMLRGKIHEIMLVVQRHIEAERFAFQLLSPFQDAGISCRILKMPPGEYVTAFGLIMYSPSVETTDGSGLVGDPLYEALKAANLYGGSAAQPVFAFGSEYLHPNAPHLPRGTYILYVGQKPE